MGAIERSRSESRRGVTRRDDRELKPSDWPAVHGPPAAARGSKGTRPFGAQGSGDGARHPRETPHGRAVAGMPVRVAAVAIPPRSRRPSAPSRSRGPAHVLFWAAGRPRPTQDSSQRAPDGESECGTAPRDRQRNPHAARVNSPRIISLLGKRGLTSIRAETIGEKDGQVQA